MEITTTLNRIRAHETCAPVLEKLLTQLGKTQADDEPLRFSTILDCSGLDNALLCCQAEPQHVKLWRHFAVDCAESVKHLMGSRGLEALSITRRYVMGEATSSELGTARNRAYSAAHGAYLTALLVNMGGQAGSASAKAREAAALAAYAVTIANVGVAASSAAGTVKAQARMAQHFRRIVTAGWAPIIVKEEI